MKMLHSVAQGGDPSEAQGKSMRVSRAWVPPWVLESRSDRPSRRVSRPAALSEAERDRDLVSVSAKRRWSCESWTRPRMNRHSNPGLGRRSFHSRHRALGCVRAAPSVLKTTSQSLDRWLAVMRTAEQATEQTSCRTGWGLSPWPSGKGPSGKGTVPCFRPAVPRRFT